MPNNRDKIQKKVLEMTLDHQRCGLGISMGVGKTRIAIQHLQKNYNPFIKALVVIPKNSVSQSWMDELERMNIQSMESHLTFSTYLSINKHNPDDYDIVYLDECHSLLEKHDPFLKKL